MLRGLVPPIFELWLYKIPQSHEDSALECFSGGAKLQIFYCNNRAVAAALDQGHHGGLIRLEVSAGSPNVKLW